VTFVMVCICCSAVFVYFMKLYRTMTRNASDSNRNGEKKKGIARGERDVGFDEFYKSDEYMNDVNRGYR